MKELEDIQKLAILHCVYQLIASADGSIEDERDLPAIDFALSELGVTSAYSWNSALQLNPYDCFTHVAGLNDDNKQLFWELLFVVTTMGGNETLRITCAKHLLQLCNVVL